MIKIFYIDGCIMTLKSRYALQIAKIFFRDPRAQMITISDDRGFRLITK